MNLRSLMLFRHIVLTGSLSEAAKRLNMSASAASRLLTQLEEQLSLTLFSRSRRNLKLTEDGALFYRQISNTLNGLEEVPLIAEDIQRRGVPAKTATKAHGATGFAPFAEADGLSRFE